MYTAQTCQQKVASIRFYKCTAFGFCALQIRQCLKSGSNLNSFDHPTSVKESKKGHDIVCIKTPVFVHMSFSFRSEDDPCLLTDDRVYMCVLNQMNALAVFRLPPNGVHLINVKQ